MSEAKETSAKQQVQDGAPGKDTTFDLSPAPGAVHSRKRVGRGNGSGLGKTSGRGQKGQNSRKGRSTIMGFEGGQMPLQRRIPKRGFVNINKVEYTLIKLQRLSQIKDLPQEVTKETLEQFGLAKQNKPVKILGNDNLDKPLNITVDKVTKGAREQIEKAGGTVTELPSAKQPLKKWQKKEKSNKMPRKEKKTLQAMKDLEQ